MAFTFKGKTYSIKTTKPATPTTSKNIIDKRDSSSSKPSDSTRSVSTSRDKEDVTYTVVGKDGRVYEDIKDYSLAKKIAETTTGAVMRSDISEEKFEQLKQEYTKSISKTKQDLREGKTQQLATYAGKELQRKGQTEKFEELSKEIQREGYKLDIKEQRELPKQQLKEPPKKISGIAKPATPEETPSKFLKFIETQKQKLSREETASVLTLPAETIRTSKLVIQETGKQLQDFGTSLLSGSYKSAKFTGATIERTIPVSPVQLGKVFKEVKEGKTETLDIERQRLSTGVKGRLQEQKIATQKFTADPDVKTTAITAGFILAPEFGVAGVIGSIAGETTLAGYGAYKFIKEPSIETGATAILTTAPIVSRALPKKPSTYRTPEEQLFIQMEDKIPMTREPFISKTTETFIPFDKKLDIVKGRTEPVVETIKVTEKPSGFDIPTRLPRKGEFKSQDFVLPEAEVFIRPIERQLQLQPKKFDPFAEIRQREFAPEQIGIKEPTFIEKAKLDPTQAKFKTEFDPIPERVKTLSRARNQEVSLKDFGIQEVSFIEKARVDTKQTKLDLFEPISIKSTQKYISLPDPSIQISTPKTIKVPFIRRPSRTLIKSKRGELGETIFDTFEVEVPTSVSRNIARIKELPRKVSETPAIVRTSVKRVPRSKIIPATDSFILGKQQTTPFIDLRQPQITTPSLTITPITGITPIQIQKPSTDITPISAPIISLKQLQPKDIFKPPKITETIKRTTPKIIKPKERIPKPLPFFNLKPKKQKQEKGYDVYVKKGKRAVKLNIRPQGRRNAESVLANTLDKKGSYDGYIKPTGKRINKLPVNPYYSKNKFKFTKKNNRLIEKKKYRKDSLLE